MVGRGKAGWVGTNGEVKGGHKSYEEEWWEKVFSREKGIKTLKRDGENKNAQKMWLVGLVSLIEG